ncbi:Glycosyltransferase, GT2 family [Saccharopolyspora antimicrobica]|uniref:GT2 family glycosyltransferase n=1 Tax=Saccharopolyspora antimicrobica TaxID=455193 RepID=A0A1I5KUQ3_9PSEU|nr:glycosyltransferase [Saccharopolyspora antimicrobica]RKT89116.1 GT2 family glycosyltransferase [Saccharopolyspora antimicrobica]SFO88859.1 Glycosyltransferase, GT2 family [Saccharopolyspora antimicrobica]
MPPGTDHRVSVVIVTHNRCAEVLRTLTHMTGLPEKPPIVVVDNGSNDGTSERIRTDFPDVRLLSHRENLGAVGRNWAVEHVSTPYVAFCDDDTTWQPGALGRAAAVLDRFGSVAAVMGRCLVEPDLHEDPLVPELRESPVPAPHWLPGPALMSLMAGLTTFRVAAFREAGGFSPKLWLGGEEELLALDLVAAGWWLCWRPDIVIHHAPSPSRNARLRRQLGIRNTVLTAWLRRPVRDALRRSATVAASAPKDRCTLAALVAAARATPWVLRERRVVPERIERCLRVLEEPQRHSPARRYVG